MPSIPHHRPKPGQLGVLLAALAMIGLVATAVAPTELGLPGSPTPAYDAKKPDKMKKGKVVKKGSYLHAKAGSISGRIWTAYRVKVKHHWKTKHHWVHVEYSYGGSTNWSPAAMYALAA
jgi:hypothetical protein